MTVAVCKHKGMFGESMAGQSDIAILQNAANLEMFSCSGRMLWSRYDCMQGHPNPVAQESKSFSNNRRQSYPEEKG
jgi:hypothetical protein